MREKERKEIEKERVVRMRDKRVRERDEDSLRKKWSKFEKESLTNRE